MVPIFISQKSLQRASDVSALFISRHFVELRILYITKQNLIRIGNDHIYNWAKFYTYHKLNFMYRKELYIYQAKLYIYQAKCHISQKTFYILQGKFYIYITEKIYNVCQICIIKKCILAQTAPHIITTYEF